MTKFTFSAIIVLLALMILSCEQKTNNYLVELNDSTKSKIKSYVQDNNVDLKSKVISTQWVVNGDRTDIYITNLDSKLYLKLEFTPTYYSVIEDDIIVFIYSGIEQSILRNNYDEVSEINVLLDQYQVNLKNDSANFYYAPTWLYSICPESSELIKKIDPMEYNFIPCNYKLLQDTIRNDSLFVFRTFP